MIEVNELLFFDTFSHESSEELNLDLVQFPRPVYINEIRIIPLGARVQADFPGGHRLGATNPSSFQLEFFVNDLSKRGACTFERMGSLEYKQNVDIQFLFGNKVRSNIPTDGLVIRGWYSTVTLAIYGVLTKVTKERVISPPPPPQISSRTPVESLSPVNYDQNTPEHNGNSSNKWERPARPENVSESLSPPPPPPPSGHDPRSYSEAPPSHSDSRLPFKERTSYMEPPSAYNEHHPAPAVTTSTQPPVAPRTGYNKFENYTKPWTGTEEAYHKKHENFEGYHGRNPAHTWEKHSDLREVEITREEPYRSGDFVKEKEHIPVVAHEFPEERRVLLKDPKRRDHHEPTESFGRDIEWSKESRAREKEREKEHERNRRERERGSRDSRAGSSRSRESSHDRKADFNRRPASPLSPTRVIGQPKTPPPLPEHSKKIKEVSEGEFAMSDDNQMSGEDLFEPVSPQTPVDEYLLSDREIRYHLEHMEDIGYEEILSEEEEMSDGDERNLEMGEMEYDLGDDAWNLTSAFNPFQCEFADLLHFKDPSWSLYEINQDKAKSIQDSELPDESKKLIQLLKQFEDKERNEKWVEALEVVPGLVETGLGFMPFGDSFNFACQTLLDWQKEALSYEAAITQAQTPFKVRHLKAGIKLATTLFQTDDIIVKRLLKQGCAKQLLELYSQQYMSLPVKLLIIRALDTVTFTSEGLKYFLSAKLYFKTPHCASFKTHLETDQTIDESEDRWLTGYQRLWEILLVKEPTRAVVALQSLVNKLHVFEVLMELKENVEKISHVVPSVAPNESPKKSVELDSDSLSQDILDSATGGSVTVENYIFNIICGFNEITKNYENAEKLIAQLTRYLPATTQFVIPNTLFDPYPGLYRMFKECSLLECVFILVTSPFTSTHTGITSAIKDLLSQFLLKNSGMKYLMVAPQIINGIHRALFQVADENREESGDESIANQLGLSLVCALQSLQHIDSLLSYHHGRGADKKDVDDPEAVSSLHNLYSMTFGAIGKMAVITLLAMENNLESLIPFIELTSTNSEELDAKQSKSVCCGYASELLLLTVHHSESMDLINIFGERLVILSQQAKLNELSRWMCPLKKGISLTHESINYLMTSYVKKFMTEVSSLPPELITALRILEYTVIPRSGLKEVEPELKYKYAMLQLFANDALESYLGILQQICDNFLKPTQHSVLLVGQQGALVLSVVKPIVAMLHMMLAHLIRCRGTEFKDLTAVPVLLRLHTLLCLFPMSSYMYSVAQQVQNEVIASLLCYTQPVLAVTESEEAVSKSLWTQTVSEILKYTVIAPNTWMTGLTILSELLPLPLPLQTKEALNSAEISRAINSRKLWSAHLHSLSNRLEQVIISMAATSCQPLQQLLRRICVQLADLAAPTAIVVVRAVLDVLKDSIQWGIITPPVETKDENPILDIPKPCSSSTSRILDFLSYMVSNATFKITLLHILSGALKTDGKYEDIMCKITTLLNLPSISTTHQHGQENIVSIIQSLCDPEIGLVTLETGSSVLDVVSKLNLLGNSMPSKDLLKQMVTALVMHIGDHQHPFASVLPSLRTLVMITEHDLGLISLKMSLEANTSVLSSLLQRLSSSFSKVSSDCLSTLSTALELLRLLVQGYEEPAQTSSGLRNLNLTSSELVPLLQWTKPTDSTVASIEPKIEAGDAKPDKEEIEIKKCHPLMQLEKQLTDCLNDEDVLESLLESLQGIISTLNEGMDKEKTEKECPEPILPPSDSLIGQFTSRTVFVVGDVDEERLSPSYWLSLLGVEDADQDVEQVQTDLVSIAEKLCPDFDLKNGLQKLCFVDDVDKEIETNKKKTDIISGKRHYLKQGGGADAPIKKPFIAPMRGRGFNRGGMHSGRANDPFRSRPPNTSRPPSMHVDDFLAMEYQGPTPSPNLGIPKRPIKEVPRGRGRGFDPSRGFGSTRARFFSPPSVYSRRETNRTSLPFLFETSSAPRPTGRPLMSAWAGRSGPLALPKSQMGLHSFARGRLKYSVSHSDRGSSSQRPRDPYSLVNPSISSSSSGSSFSRSARSIAGISSSGGRSPNMGSVLSVQSHWLDPRMKMQDTRFIPQSGVLRGRRDIMNRHARSFTR